MSDQPSDQPSEQPSEQPSDPAAGSSDPADQSPGPADQPPGPAPFGDAIRSKFEEYEVEHRLEELASEVEDVVRRGMEAVGAFAHEHSNDIGDFLTRVADALDRRTEGRHADTIHDVRGQLERGVQRLAAHRPEDETGPDLGDGSQDPGESGTTGSDEADR